ncbi:MAG: RagB/SusD family nutrient uptake outer membrane protein, partial [Paludibacter sp.]
KSKDYFLGVLYRAYLGIPSRVNLTYEATTDNMVANNDNSITSKAAKFGISAQSNPLGDTWSSNYTNINYINWYMEHMVLDFTKTVPTPVIFDNDPGVNLRTFYYTLGEAYFLRAWYEFDLLQKYGGVGTDNKVYGFPIRTSYYKETDNLNVPRNTYEECVAQIAKDCDSAFVHLPLDYNNIATTATFDNGSTAYAGHASGIAAKTLKVRAFLYAASPAFNISNDVELWKRAAKEALSAIQLTGGSIALQTYANYFNKMNLNNGDVSNKDIFFRGPINAAVSTMEKENYPPRLQGNGTYNPTLNLINAFPKSDGYPADIASTVTLDPLNPHLNRDPRLDNFIVRNGESFAGITLATSTGGSDASGVATNNTRTGFYLQKLLDNAVRFTSPTVTTTMAAILLGRPELYLNFAEAAFMATGDMNSTTYTFTPKQIIRLIRERAFGSGPSTKDKYYIIGNKVDNTTFMSFVKNERRLELCFEDHRFWDLRRWCNGKNDLTPLTYSVYSIYSSAALEDRSFRSPYLPIPYGEILKSPDLVNNAGY